MKSVTLGLIISVRPLNAVITPPLIGKRRIVMSVSLSLSLSLCVCVCVCMCVCLSTIISPEVRNYTSDLHQFLCMLPIAVARSSSGGVLIRYAIPVL